MNLEEFIAELYRLGWTAPADAQHEHIKELWAVYARLTAENAALEKALRYYLEHPDDPLFYQRAAAALLEGK